MYRIGVDLGGTNIAVGVVDEKYNIIGEGKVKTNMPRSAEEIFKDIKNAIDIAVNDAGISFEEITSVGVGTPGSVNKENGYIEFANNLNFNQVPAKEMLEKSVNKPCYFDNDANCAALGEMYAGAGKGYNSLVAITLGTGVGSGVIMNGKIVGGTNYAAGEFGHTVIVANGEQCNCGRKGCWERYASASALISQTKAAMLDDKNSLMWEIAGSIENVDGKTAFDGMRKNDKTAIEVVNQYIYYVSIGLTNIVNALQPDVICISGGISKEGENLLAPLRKYIEKERYTKYAKKQTKLCKAVLGNDAGIIGAALLDE